MRSFINKHHKGSYASWTNMRKRCLQRYAKDYPNYGGRGITICERWNDFKCFLQDMGERPEGMSLNRVNVNGQYCKENCCWSDRREQAHNRRNTMYVEYNGQTAKLCEVAEENGLDVGLVANRIRLGWTLDEALNTDKQSRYTKKKINEIVEMIKACKEKASRTGKKVSYEPIYKKFNVDYQRIKNIIHRYTKKVSQ